MEEEKITLKRHIDKWLINWKNKKNHKPVLIKGIRQSGKTYSIKQFAEQNYKCIVYLNFWDNPNLIDAFNGKLDIDSIIRELSVIMKLPNLIKKETIFIFDEIQDCPRALLSLKTNMSNRDYDFIASGSYLGINGYAVNDQTPKPVGAVEEFTMHTLDFEEFLWAKGVKPSDIKNIEIAFYKKTPVSLAMHKMFSYYFKEYLCVGGFPESVVNYINTNNISIALETTKNIVTYLQNDFGRRRGANNQPLFNVNEVARIREVFSLIPSFLGKENKRFIVSKIYAKGSKNHGKDAINYLQDAGVIIKVNNLKVPATPLSINKIPNQFKIFPTDIGMLVSMLEEGVTEAIFSNNLGMGKGMLYEGVIADILSKKDVDLFYYAKDTGLELDFVINYKGISTILEVKSANGNAKSAKTVLSHPDHYGKTQLIVIKDANIGYDKNILTIPHYMTYLLFK